MKAKELGKTTNIPPLTAKGHRTAAETILGTTRTPGGRADPVWGPPSAGAVFSDDAGLPWWNGGGCCCSLDQDTCRREEKHRKKDACLEHGEEGIQSLARLSRNWGQVLCKSMFFFLAFHPGALCTWS